jgi:hypothetical protein
LITRFGVFDLIEMLKSLSKELSKDRRNYYFYEYYYTYFKNLNIEKGILTGDNYFFGLTTIKIPFKYIIFISFNKGFVGMCKSRRDLQRNVVNS